MANPFSKEEKLFSICSPCYKDTYKHLDGWVDALGKQEYKNWEAIVVFDGPNKRGVREMERLIKKHHNLNLQYYVKEHGGACSARNYAVERSKGDYIAFPSPDCYLYPEALRIWANEFEDLKINRVWGMYDIIQSDGNISQPVGNAPVDSSGKVWYPAFKFSPYCDGTFPIRRTAYIEWDESCKSLNDWEYSLRLLKKTNFRGDDWKYIHHSFFAAEAPQPGGLSDHSHQNWKSQSTSVKSKNGIENNDICVASMGAPTHAFKVSDILGADYLRMPSFKDHDYKMVYLLGFYTKEDPTTPYVTKAHMDVFENNKGVNVIHWIGTDILQLRWNCSFEKIKALKKWFKEKKIIHLAECEWTQKELAEVGIKARVVPIPPSELYQPIPLPEEFTVGIYDPNSEMYNKELMLEIKRACPDIRFYFFGDPNKKGTDHLGWIDLKEWMPKFSCNLRVTVHDGLPLTPLQFLTAGRNVVYNYPLKGAIECTKSRESIVKALREAQKKPLSPEITKYWQKELSHDKYKKTIEGLK